MRSSTVMILRIGGSPTDKDGVAPPFGIVEPVHYLYEARAMQDGCGRFVFGGDWRG